MLPKTVLLNCLKWVTACVAAFILSTAFASAQVVSSDESLTCNSVQSCGAVSSYFLGKANKSRKPYQQQYDVLQDRALFVETMYLCDQLQESLARSLSSTGVLQMPPTAWQQQLLAAQARAVLIRNSLNILVSASGNDPKTAEMVSLVVPFASKAIAMCRPAPY